MPSIRTCPTGTTGCSPAAESFAATALGWRKSYAFLCIPAFCACLRAGRARQRSSQASRWGYFCREIRAGRTVYLPVSVEGALLARFAGCTLGVPVENWPIERMANLAKENMIKAQKDLERTQQLFDKSLESQAILDTVYASSQGWDVLIPLVASVGGFVAAIVIGGIAGLYPAMRAARVSPTEALRTL